MLENVGLGMVKNRCGQSDGGTLKLTVCEEWTDRINDSLNVNGDSHQKFMGRHCQKWLWPVCSWEPKIDCISKINIEETDFLHAVTNLEKLKVDSIIFGLAFSKMALAF